MKEQPSIIERAGPVRIGSLLLILLLASALRLPALRDNPGWYSDEGTHLAIAGAMAGSDGGYLAVEGPTLLFAKLPLFEHALALLLRCCGDGMSALRGFTAAMGIASVLLLYLAVRRTDAGPTAALTGAGALAVYPTAVLYNRFGFSYNLLTPLVLITFIGLYEFAVRNKRGGLLLAAGAVGLGLTSDLLMGAYVLIVLLVATVHRQKLSRPVVVVVAPLLFGPFTVYAGILHWTAADIFWFDLDYTLGRLGGISPGRQLWILAENYTLLLSQNSWWALGLAGLFLLPRQVRAPALLFLLVPVLAVGRSEALHGLSFYYMIPVLPFVALGVGALFHYGFAVAAKRLAAHLSAPVARIVAGMLLITPLLVSTHLTWQHARRGFPTAIDPFLVAGPEARAATAYVNRHLRPGELTLASPAVAWLVEGNVADYQMAVAATGRATPHLPADIPSGRWAFDPRFGRARFVIVDNLWRNWAVFHVPGVQEMLAEVEKWPVPLAAGGVRVYERP